MMQQSVMIRRAQHLDAVALAELQVASWRATYPGLIPQAVIDGKTVDSRTRAWRDILTPPDDGSATFVGVLPGRGVIGFISGGPSKDPLPDTPGQVYGLYLHPDCLGLGLGRRLMVRMAAYLEDRGEVPIQVRAVVGNTRAERAYRSWGAVPVGVEDFELDGAPLKETVFRFTTTDALVNRAEAIPLRRHD